MVKTANSVKSIGLEKEIEQILKQSLSEVPFLQLKRLASRKQAGPDSLIQAKFPGGRTTIIAEREKSGQPRRIRDAINQLLRYKESYPEAYPVVLAPYISPTSAKLCREAGVGFVDSAGNCHLTFDQVYIQREGCPNPFTEKRELRSLYSPKASRILRVLLLNPGNKWKMQNLATEADVSLGLVAKVKELLLDREWVLETEQGLEVAQPEALLAQWAEQYDFEKNDVRSFYTMRDVADAEEKLSELCRKMNTRFALTGFAGAARIAPFVRYNMMSTYVSGDPDKIAAEFGLKPVPSGANVQLIIPYDAGVFYASNKFDEISVVSSVQLYLDLMNMPGRGEDAAQFLLEEAVRPYWK